VTSAVTVPSIVAGRLKRAAMSGLIWEGRLPEQPGSGISAVRGWCASPHRLHITSMRSSPLLSEEEFTKIKQIADECLQQRCSLAGRLR
jgi:hypothetical protein